jgi:UDP-N-acetylmuramoyl-L-alanyl-D-glutamate--2,6-diaminopimelate ligase
MLKVIGITGTNGKTSVSYILEKILKEAGYKTAIIGTLTGRLTTPSPWELQEAIADLKKQNYDYLLMEVSSHGIHQDRIKGISFLVKLLTNITQDHLNYHKTWRAYRQVKLGWMKKGDNIKIYPKDYKNIHLPEKLPLLGLFNYHNFQAAAAVARSLGLFEETILRGIGKVEPIPGRFENIEEGQNFKVVVDYAHTPDGLKNVLKTCHHILKEQKEKGRLITLFGCGGDRDTGKRPKMGCLARSWSDTIIVTSDNPRNEDPHKIIKEILAGFNGFCWRELFKKDQVVHVEEDRRKAIKLAIGSAKENDIVLLAGKGHENYQIVKETRLHLDDREEARKVLQQIVTDPS